MADEVTTKIRAYLTRRFSNFDLRDDEDLRVAGFVNSLVAMEMVAFVEREYGVKLAEKDLTWDNFRTIDDWSRLVEGRR
jgi:acyl carrier protein